MKIQKILKTFFGSFMLLALILGFTSIGSVQAAGPGGDPACGYQSCDGFYYYYNAGNGCCYIDPRAENCPTAICS